MSTIGSTWEEQLSAFTAAEAASVLDTIEQFAELRRDIVSFPIAVQSVAGGL